MILHMWKDDTMWKYRDLVCLTKNQYFKYFITKHNAKYKVIDKNIVIIFDGILLRFYGFTIENCLYNNIFIIHQNKLVEYNATTIMSTIWLSEEQLSNSWDLFRQTAMYNHSDNLAYENDLFYNLWLIDNFWSSVNISDVVYASKGSAIKKIYASKVPDEYFRIMLFYFPTKYAVSLLKALLYFPCLS